MIGGFNVFGASGAAILGSIVIGVVLLFKFTYDTGIAAKTIMKFKDAAARKNQVVQQEIQQDNEFMAVLFAAYQVGVNQELDRPLAAPDTLPQCPADCAF